MSTTSLHQRYLGTYLGSVLATDDPAGLGRVRVELDQVGDTSDEPLWATVTRPLAGADASMFFTPRPGDQVVVAYLQGDPRHPVVLGYAHHLGRQLAGATPRRHQIVTAAGRLEFDDDLRRIVIEVGSTKVSIGAQGIAIEAASFTINGQPVVLGPFLQAFNTHVHQPPAPGVPPTPVIPAGGGPPNTTNG